MKKQFSSITNSLANKYNSACLGNRCMSVEKFATSNGDDECGNSIRAMQTKPSAQCQMQIERLIVLLRKI
ncbi:MAG: hypothetical protein CMN21_09930 [Rubinisphaera sp.]|nr:hypothetical protein [Rubinisphaera sp.]|tara:strand:+ start:1163 stop:1372 length:210 start_codon:yes stop_codon:yes gene_type:complete